MSAKDGDEFENVWIDINSFTAKDWDEISKLAQILRDDKFFKGDPFKCVIAAFVLWVAEGGGNQYMDQEPAPDGTLLN